MATPEEVKELQAKIVQGLMAAKTEEDLEAVNDLTDAAVGAGWLTQEEVDAIWEEFEPDLTNY